MRCDVEIGFGSEELAQISKGKYRKFSVVVDSMVYVQYCVSSDYAQNKPARDIVGHIASVNEQLNVSCRRKNNSVVASGMMTGKTCFHD